MKKKSIITLLVALCVVATTFAAKQPKYIFLFIGDGMGMGHVMAAENYNRLILKNLNSITMMQFPVASMAMTYSANSPITDSAAAGTALATGTKTKNYMIGMAPDSTAVTSVATELKQKYGYGVGLVTAVAFDDATPATHYAHRANRNMFEGINYDGARSGFEFLGGAYTHAAEESEEAAQRIFADYRENGYTVAHGIKQLREAKPGKKVLLTAANPVTPNEIGYTIDSIPDAMTLQELTTECLAHLQKVSPKGFFMMVEGGNIDHAAHGNDGGAVVKEVINFQKSLQIAYDFYQKHPNETLIVVTADHDTGGMTTGVTGGPKIPDFSYIDYQKISKEQFSDLCAKKRMQSWDEMKQLLAEKLGLWAHIPVNESEEARMIDSFGKLKANTADAGQKTLYKEFNNFTAVVFDILNHKNGFGFTTFSHTGNPVPVFAVGVGCEEFSDVNNNVEIPRKIRRLTGLAK